MGLVVSGKIVHRFILVSVLLFLVITQANAAENGTVLSWGNNWFGRLGSSTIPVDWYSGSAVPVQVNILSNVTAVSAGKAYHTLALKNDGTVWAWGSNWYGQLGNSTIAAGEPYISAVPVKVDVLSNVIAIAAGEDHSLALKSNGTVWAWGSNNAGQLGDGTQTIRTNPVQVSGLTGVISVSAGGYHSLALKSDGTVWAWGSNWYGQLGDGTQTIRTNPVQVSGLTGVISVSTGGYHSLALKSNGTVWAWGWNSGGLLGDGTTVDKYTPVQVIGLSGIVNVSGGGWNSFAIKSDGTVWVWGSNEFGLLGSTIAMGEGSYSAYSALPVQFAGLTGIKYITASRRHSIALMG